MLSSANVVLRLQEDVVQLVELSEDPRANRRERIAQIQWERRDPRLTFKGAPLSSGRKAASVYEERIYERDVIYENQARLGYR